MFALTRRAFAGHVAALVSALAVSRRALAGGVAGALLPRAAAPDHGLLLALGEAVLPSELGTPGIRRAVTEFERWLAAYRPGAEVLHGYGTAKLERLPASPAARWSAQLRELERDARKRHGEPLAHCSVAQRRALVHDRLRREKLGAMPSPLEAGHVAVGLLAHFYGSPAATDLCYQAAIGKTTCRPLAEQARAPAPLRRPV